MSVFRKGRFVLIDSIILAVLLICSCNVPSPIPTETQTPDWTSTPIPPSATPTQRPTATATPVPEYLTVPSEDLAGTKLILRGSLYGAEQKKLDELVITFNKENEEGVTVQPIYAENMDELGSITSKDSPSKTDLIIADSAWLRRQNAYGKPLMDLSAFMNMPETALDGDDITPLMDVMLDTENQNEAYYALPLWADPAFLFYNKTWAIELGYSDSPSGLASFAEQACAAGKANYTEKDDSKHGTGGWIVSSAPKDVLSWMLIFTQKGENPGELIRSQNGDVFIDTASWLRNLFDNGCAWNSRVKEPYDYFANRYALFYSGTYSDAKRQYNAFEQSEAHGFDNWDLIVYPPRESGEKQNPRIAADMVSIAVPESEDAKKVNAAWHFIRWLYQGEHAAELALAAIGWPVQDSDEITALYRKSGEDKLYQTLSYRQYLVSNDADENWLTDQLILADGFNYIFNPSAKPENIPEIWEQIGDIIAEINEVNNLSSQAGTENPNKILAAGEGES